MAASPIAPPAAPDISRTYIKTDEMLTKYLLEDFVWDNVGIIRPFTVLASFAYFYSL